MAELPDAWLLVLNALIEAPVAWRSPAEIAAALGRGDEETTDLLCDLDVAGWLEVWEAESGPLVTLSALAAERLGVRLVEVGPGETPRWARAGDPDPPRPAAKNVCLTRAGRVAGVRRSTRPRRPTSPPSGASAPQALARPSGRRPRRARPRREDPPRPTLLVGLEPDPLARPPGRLAGAVCPACGGRTLGPQMYCLYCDRWGLDRLRSRRRRPPAAPRPRPRPRPSADRAAAEKLQAERLRARRRSKRARRHRARPDADRATTRTVSRRPPTAPNDRPRPAFVPLHSPAAREDLGQRRAVVVGRVQVPQGLQVRVDRAQLVGLDDPGPHRLHQEDGPEPVLAQQVLDRGQDGRAAVEGGERVVIAVGERDRQVVVADQRGEPVDPGRLEERDVGGRGVDQLDRVRQRRQPGGEALERAAPGDRVADDRHPVGQRGELLPGRRDDHDRPDPGRRADQPDDPLEHPLGAERQPRLGPAHPPALAPAEDHGPEVHPAPPFVVHEEPERRQPAADVGPTEQAAERGDGRAVPARLRGPRSRTARAGPAGTRGRSSRPPARSPRPSRPAPGRPPRRPRCATAPRPRNPAAVAPASRPSIRTRVPLPRFRFTK